MERIINTDCLRKFIFDINQKCYTCGNKAYNSLQNPSVYYCDKHFKKIMDGVRDQVQSKKLSLQEAVGVMKAFEKRT